MNIIELLFFDDCPSWKTGLENLRAAIKDLELPAEIKLVKIVVPNQAHRERFLGSPSFRVNGVDLWQEERNTYDLSCRVYKTQAGIRGAPTVEMLKETLMEKIHG